MSEKLVLGGTWTENLPIFSPDALTSAPSRQGSKVLAPVWNIFILITGIGLPLYRRKQNDLWWFHIM